MLLPSIAAAIGGMISPISFYKINTSINVVSSSTRRLTCLAALATKVHVNGYGIQYSLI